MVSNENIQSSLTMPQFPSSPGSSPTSIIIVDDTHPTRNNDQIKSGCYSSKLSFGILSSTCVSVGCLMIIIGSLLLLIDPSHFRVAGGLISFGYLVWIVEPVISFLMAIRNHITIGRQWINLLAITLSLIGFFVLSLGALFWIKDRYSNQMVGELLWVVGGSLLLLSHVIKMPYEYSIELEIAKSKLLHPFSSYVDPSTPILRTATTQRSYIRLKALATGLFVIGYVLFLCGAGSLLVRSVRGTTNDPASVFEQIGAVLWICASGVTIFASFLAAIVTDSH
jgi:hypothetical protein